MHRAIVVASHGRHCLKPSTYGSTMPQISLYNLECNSCVHSASIGTYYSVPSHSSARFQVSHEVKIKALQDPCVILRTIREAMQVALDRYVKSYPRMQVHGSISPSTVFINSSGHGDLSVNCNPNDYFFQSAENLARRLDLSFTEPDYVDDLESFYYVLLWMCFQNGPQSCYLPCFQGDPRACLFIMQNKKTMLFSGTGINTRQYPLNGGWGNDLVEELLDIFRFTIAALYEARRSSAYTITSTQLCAEAQRDYRFIMSKIDTIVATWNNRWY